LLLVLDNCEHLVAACAHLAEALRPCPKLQILATRREALASDGERVYRLPPLSLRNADDTKPIS
jgi:predicted ATPase